MPRTPEENERIKKDKKERILKAGLTVFAENGLAAAKMSDIAQAAGVSYGLVYTYFSSKEQIFVELLNDLFASSNELVAQLKNMKISPLERIKVIFTQLFTMHNNDPTGELYYRLMLQLTFHPHLWDKLLIKDVYSEPVFQLIFETIKQGQQSGEIIDINPQEIVLLLGYIALGFNLRGHEIFENDLNEKNIVDLIIRMIKK
ncbi:MAG: TetR/AcrR family transcriptional regulator [Spirochaetales bacterium]|nr:TetR/AcrR family transcriptional regulator [Spirochaetales bacterium]